MHRFKWATLALLCILFLWGVPAVSAAEAEHGAAGWGWWETLGRWFNLAVLFGLILYAVRQPAREYFEKRRSEIQREMREAQEARLAAEKRMAEIEARMANLDTELEGIRTQAEAEAAAERARILDLARQESEKILAQARREIEGLGRTVRKDLREYTAQLAVELAEAQIRTQLSDRHEKRLAERFVSGLASTGEMG